MTRIASRVSQLHGEGALAVYSRAKELERQGRSIIHLELGEPDFHPAAPVVDALRSAVAAGRDRYCSTRGVSALREAIADYLKRTRSVDATGEQVIVAPGCKMALSLAMMALIEPGDKVLYPDPSFPIYPSFARGLGATAVSYGLEEKNKFQPDVDEIARKITRRPSAHASSSSLTRTTRREQFSATRFCGDSPGWPRSTIFGLSRTKFTRAFFSAGNTNPSGRFPAWRSAR